MGWQSDVSLKFCPLQTEQRATASSQLLPWAAYRFAGLDCHPPHRVPSAVIAHADWKHFTGTAGLCLLALVSDLGLLRVLAGLGNIAVVSLLGELGLLGKLILLLLGTRRDLFKLLDVSW